MEERWLFPLFCFLWVPSITGQSRDVLTETEVVSALPGTDVTLMCLFPKSRITHIIQTQWSKTEDSQSTKLAVYHPIYGTHYFKFSEASYNFSVSFSTRECCSQDVTESLCSTNPNTPSECNQWALHLKNVTIALSGQYKCSFATYPYGTKAANIQLIVKAEEEQHYLKKVWLNQTLEIPCLEDTTSEDLSTYPLKWLVGDNDRKEELVTKEPSCPAVYRNSSSVYGQRIRLGLNNTLKIFPTKITDDGRVFSCHVMYHPERVQKRSTTVRVYGDSMWVAGTPNQSTFLGMPKAFGDGFDWQAPRGTNNWAYPEISVSLQEGSAGTSQKPSVSCVVRKAFPKPSLVWYVDRVNLMEQPREILVVQDDLQDSEGFYQMTSTLMLQGTQETHKTFSCACLFSSLGSETWNISSEEIFVSFDNKSNEASSEAFTTPVSEDLGNSTLTSAVMTSSEPQSTSLASLDFTSQANLAPASTTKAGALTSRAETKCCTSARALSESLTTAHLNDSTTESPQSLSNATHSSENTTLTHSNLFYRITDQTISVTRGKDFFTASSLLNSTGERNTNASRFPWPTVVAILLLLCSSLIAVGIRKWCQYQKEIMNRPPSFKPPPPPIKYTSMVESDGTAPSCHELENL